MELAKHFIFLGFILFSFFQTPAFATTNSYIVYLGSHSHGREATNVDFDRVTESHHEFLGSFLGSSAKAKEVIIYSYTRHINGFAAILDEKVAAEIEKHPAVLKVFPNKGRKLHTTRSWQFMSQTASGVALSDSAFKKARFGEDTIIGNIDTGAWPESLSFSDEGIGPIPSRWKGACDVDHDPKGIRCNRKLIGARYFNKAYLAFVGNSSELNQTLLHTPRDNEGHGTHTLSTAGGSFVYGANISGRLANGTASGGSPKARVATYKVCWPPFLLATCFDADILAAFDMAIHDGVDVLSISLGAEPADYVDDFLAVGAFHAFKNGISVVCSAGNDGPYSKTVTNIAPWIFTVGASTLDRGFQAFVELNNGKIFQGQTLSEALPEDKFYPLIGGVEAKMAKATADDAKLCLEGTIEPKKVKGKILVCLRGGSARLEKSNVALKAGAIGMILCNDEIDGDELFADLHMLPAANIKYEDTLALFAYLNSTKNPTGTIHPPTDLFNMKPSPVMATFSARGPSRFVPEILKPDITAPGVDILAAYTQAIGPTDYDFDNRRFPFVLLSGTSMSCPHVAGVVGLLKTLYPDWSPSAIKSAIMTSAKTRDNTRYAMLNGVTLEKATPFDYGSGHIRPNKAIDPGLVYDLTINDYLNVLCALSYNSKDLRVFYDAPYKCPYSFNLLNLNYPSISIPNLYGSVNVTRTLKNVGLPGTYVARVHSPAGVAINVEPKTLKFEKVGEEKSFTLTIEVTRNGAGTAFGRLIWSDGKHFVRSPISVGGVIV